MTEDSQRGFTTRAIHYGYRAGETDEDVTPPIHVSSTYAFPSAEQGAARMAGTEAGYVYTRPNNPTNALLEARIANLEGGAACVVFGSGMGALAATLWTLLRPGDEVVAHDTLYGCAYDLLTQGLSRFGVTVIFADLRSRLELERVVGDRTRVVLFETPVNPTMDVLDISSIAEIAHQVRAKVIVDSTFCSPYLTRPLALGADLVIHSATKYLGGHSDVLGGAVIGGVDVIDEVRGQGLKHLTGAVLSPRDAHLILRGLQTLAVRLERQCDSAEAIAGYLERHPMVTRVNYPGLGSFPGRGLARSQMRRAGGILSFELTAGRTGCFRFMDRLALITRAVSLGGSQSLVEHPASMTHATLSAAPRPNPRVTDSLVRLSVGLEDFADLKADIAQALDSRAR